MHKHFELFMAVCLLLASFLLARKGAALAAAHETDKNPLCIVIDAGHGGNDPGKIGVHNELEKDINLALAQKLEPLLDNKQISVVQTREADICLADESAASLKRADMQKRVQIIRDASPVLVVSIHQNSYTDSSVSGPQVFYYSGSDEGKAFAACMQESLNTWLSPEKPRTIKANNDYYILKNTPAPTIIIECGFLSNPTEASLLTDDLYQDKVVRAIYMGLCEYLTNHGYLS